MNKIVDSIKIVILVIVSLMVSTNSAHCQEQFSRGIEKSVFVPKGQWITGVSVNYSHTTQNNYSFFIVEGINGDTYSFKLSPTALYAFKDNLAVGAKLSYGRDRIKLNAADVVLSSDNNFNIDNLYSINQNYTGSALLRYYINLGQQKRFGLFAEAQLNLGFGQSKLAQGTGVDFTGSYERNFHLGLGVAPGIMMFLNNYSAIEVNVGVLGFNYNHAKQTTDQVYVANRDNASASFKINLFSISFGVMFYL